MGTGVALVTPFTAEGEVDYDSLSSLVENVISQGVNYIVALGTTSENPTLTCEERTTVVSTIVATANRRVPIVLGVGGFSTHEVLQQIKSIDFTGIDAILSVTPYYNKPSQEGIYEHFKTIAQESPVPVILYNVPGRSACNMNADTVLRLANDCPNIIGIKEASGMINQIMTLVKKAPKDFYVISGDDAITLPLIAAGADGVISVVANAFPKEVSQMVSLALNDQITEARKIHLSLLDITPLCFREGNPAGIKAVLALQDKIKYNLRLPLVRVSAELQQTIRETLKNR